MDIYVVFKYFLTFLIYSFVGWLMEVIRGIIRNKKFVDRGFLIGPYCPIYGYGMLLIVFLLKDYTENKLVLFILAMVICSILEYLTSYFMELIFNARWWDYSDKKYNINGRICLEYAIPFGVGGSLIMYIVHPFIMNILNSISNLGILVLGICLFLGFLVDNVISFIVLFKINGVEFDNYKDNTEEITDLVKQYLLEHSVLTNRLGKAFPNINMKMKRYHKNKKK